MSQKGFIKTKFLFCYHGLLGNSVSKGLSFFSLLLWKMDEVGIKVPFGSNIL